MNIQCELEVTDRTVVFRAGGAIVFQNFAGDLPKWQGAMVMETVKAFTEAQQRELRKSRRIEVQRVLRLRHSIGRE